MIAEKAMSKEGREVLNLEIGLPGIEDKNTNHEVLLVLKIDYYRGSPRRRRSWSRSQSKSRNRSRSREKYSSRNHDRGDKYYSDRHRKDYGHSSRY